MSLIDNRAFSFYAYVLNMYYMVKSVFTYCLLIYLISLVRYI